MLQEGQKLKWKEGGKRVWFEVTDVKPEAYQHKITFMPFYKPSPKSILHKIKSIFSKHKMRLEKDLKN